MLNWKIRSNHKVTNTVSSEAIERYQKTLNSAEIGFFRLPDDSKIIEDTKNVFNKFKHKKSFIHIGIGGSALGPEMLLAALGNKTNVNYVFINNIDPDDLALKLKKVSVKDSLIYVVSKSGTTAETVAAMSILISELKKLGITENQFHDYFVFCTDPEKGELRKLSVKWNIETLEIPSSVGGRYSVLTPCGLLPALFAGADIQEIFNGAKDIKSELFKSPDFFSLGMFLKELHDTGVNQTVMMPYSSLLREYSFWFVQLWAESLGKNMKGLTPIPAYGATDQHSQMQLFMEGPNDKTLFLIQVEKFSNDYSLENSVEADSFKNLSSFKLSDLMQAEFEGTLAALNENSRHVIHLKIPELKEYYLGQLILFAECLTVFMGELLEVNPFDQPGVEAGKKFANEWLKKHS